MLDSVRSLCVLSVLCGALQSLMPEGGAKRIAGLLSTAILVITLLTPFKELDFDSFALQSAKLRETEEEILSGASDAEQKLDRLVIERECASYILNKAEELGIALASAEVDMRWDLEGLWVPYAAELSAECTQAQKDALGAFIQSELGIPYERQRWNGDG